MIKEIIGVILILIAVIFYLKNREIVSHELEFKFFQIDKIINLITLILLLLGIFLILW